MSTVTATGPTSYAKAIELLQTLEADPERGSEEEVIIIIHRP